VVGGVLNSFTEKMSLKTFGNIINHKFWIIGAFDGVMTALVFELGELMLLDDAAPYEWVLDSIA